jgi:hypothetical protein
MNKRERDAFAGLFCVPVTCLPKPSPLCAQNNYELLNCAGLNAMKVVIKSRISQGW